MGTCRRQWVIEAIGALEGKRTNEKEGSKALKERGREPSRFNPPFGPGGERVPSTVLVLRRVQERGTPSWMWPVSIRTVQLSKEPGKGAHTPNFHARLLGGPGSQEENDIGLCSPNEYYRSPFLIIHPFKFVVLPVSVPPAT